MVPRSAFKDTWLRQDDFASGQVSQVLADVSAPGGIEAHRALFESAELNFVDGPKDGTTERRILKNLETLNPRANVIIFFDDVRLVNMIDI